MTKWFFAAVMTATLSCGISIPSAWAKNPVIVSSEQPIVMGWVEKVYIESIDSRFKAKLDTGATTSSMRAEVLNVLDEDNPSTRRVVFRVENDKGETNTLERKLVRFVRIKTKEGGLQRRPVVEMDFCIGGRHVTSEVNLAAREDFIYPVADRAQYDAKRWYYRRSRSHLYSTRSLCPEYATAGRGNDTGRCEIKTNREHSDAPGANLHYLPSVVQHQFGFVYL